MVVLIDAHGGEVSVDLCKSLHSECSIPLKDQHSMFVAYDLAKMHPEHMLLGTPEESADTSWSEGSMDKVKGSQAAINGATCVLLTYQLNPKYLKGEDLLRHMVHHSLCNPTIKLHVPSAYLDLMCT